MFNYVRWWLYTLGKVRKFVDGVEAVQSLMISTARQSEQLLFVMLFLSSTYSSKVNRAVWRFCWTSPTICLRKFRSSRRNGYASRDFQYSTEVRNPWVGTLLVGCSFARMASSAFEQERRIIRKKGAWVVAGSYCGFQFVQGTLQVFEDVS